MIRLYDLSGQLLETLDFNGNSEVIVKRNKLSCGIYLIKIVSDNLLIGTEKVIVE